MLINEQMLVMGRQSIRTKVDCSEIYRTRTYQSLSAHAVGRFAFIVSIYALMFPVWL